MCPPAEERPLLSVVIATQNSERQLVPVLSALVPGVTAGLLGDVALVDGGSTDDTSAIADAAGCLYISGSSDTGKRLKQGAAQVRGDWLMFLTPRSLLTEGWVREVGKFIETTERRGQAERMAATFRLAVDGYGFTPRLGEAVAAARLALFGLPRPEQGLIVSRRLYDRLGGHPAGLKAEGRLASRIGRGRIVLLRSQVLLPEKIA